MTHKRLIAPPIECAASLASLSVGTIVFRKLRKIGSVGVKVAREQPGRVDPFGRSEPPWPYQSRHLTEKPRAPT